MPCETQTRRARRPASREAFSVREGLPGGRAAAALAATLVAAGGDGAGMRQGAVGLLGDGERVARLRRGRDRVRRGGGATVDLDLASTVTPSEAGVPELGARVTSRVVLRIGVARLDLGNHVASVRLGGSVLALGLLAEE